MSRSSGLWEPGHGPVCARLCRVEVGLRRRLRTRPVGYRHVWTVARRRHDYDSPPGSGNVPAAMVRQPRTISGQTIRIYLARRSL